MHSRIVDPVAKAIDGKHGRTHDQGQRQRQSPNVKVIRFASESDPLGVQAHSMEWFAESSVEQCLQVLNSNKDKGLSSSEVDARRMRYGGNCLEEEQPESIWRKLLDQFLEPLVVVLVGACGFSLFLKEYADAIAIVLIIAVNAIIGVIQESRAESALAALKSMTDNPHSRVMRDGEVLTIPNTELVPGDIVTFEAGDAVPADLRVISAINLTSDQSSLTGESCEVSKVSCSINDQQQLSSGDNAYWADKAQKEKSVYFENMMYMGCNVQDGRGMGVVIRTGMQTEVGLLASALNTVEDEPSPLQESLHNLGIRLGLLCLAVCFMVFIVGFISKRGADPNSTEPVWMQMLMVSVALAVAAVPEGLPVCVTITLALGMRDMVKKKALIRNLHSVETLGSASVICTDKTGTVTQGIMSAVRVWMLGAPSGVGVCPQRLEASSDDRKDIYAEVGRSVAINSSSKAHSEMPFFYDAYINTYSPTSLMEASTSNEVLNKEGDWHRVPLLVATLCSNVKLERVDQQTLAEEDKRSQAHLTQKNGLTYKTVGNRTEIAIVGASTMAGLGLLSYQMHFKRIHEIPFSSSRKMMSCLVLNNESDDLPASFSPRMGTTTDGNSSSDGKCKRPSLSSTGVTVKDTNSRLTPFGDSRSVSCVKGAPDVILCNATHIRVAEGRVREITDRDRRLVTAQVDEWGEENAFRVLATAYRTFDDESPSDEMMERELVFCGLVALADPVRPEVKPALKVAKDAGIRTVMITGDYVATAKAIAVEVGLIDIEEKDTKVIDCGVIREITQQISTLSLRMAQIKNGDFSASALSSNADVDAPLLTDVDINEIDRIEREVQKLEIELDTLIKNNQVYARANPLDKLTIVTSIQRQGEIVALTGDGTNDAPALKKSDIGIAMGQTGKDIARAASDMILMEDDFASIVAAIEQGRIIYANIWKFVYYLLSCNVAEVMVIFICVLVGVRTPLTPIQLLWLNLVTDAAPALALAMEKGHPSIMENAPRSRDTRLMNGLMLIGTLVQMVALTSVVLFAFFWGLKDTTGSWLGINDAKSTADIDECFETARTMAYIALSMAELVRAFTVRDPIISIWSYGVFTNVPMIVGVFVSSVLCIAVTSVPVVMDLFGCNYLSLEQWGITLSAVLAPAVVDEIMKPFFRYYELSIAGSVTVADKEKSRKVSTYKKDDGDKADLSDRESDTQALLHY